MKHHHLALLGALCAVTACASKPEEIGAAYVSSLQYQDYDCRQIGTEMQRLSARVSELQGALNKKASDDAVQMGVGLVLFWPALFFLEGGDGAQAQEYARARGEFEALEKAGLEKRCNLRVERPAAPAPRQPNPSPAPAYPTGR
jgi:hypothetical protein